MRMRTRHMELLAAVPFFAAQAVHPRTIMTAADTAVQAAAARAVAEDAHHNQESLSTFVSTDKHLP
jgi:hypothetical protein